MSHQIYALLSMILSLVAFIPYAGGMVRGVVKPHLFSWLIWTLVTGLIALAQLAEGGGAGAWATVMICFLCGVTLVASLFCGETSRTRFDWICLGLALTAIPLWLLTKTPVLAVSLLTLIEYIAMGPTLRKTLKNPHSENLSFYVICVFKYALAAMALDQWSYTTALYPIATGLMALIFITIVVMRRSGYAKDSDEALNA